MSKKKRLVCCVCGATMLNAYTQVKYDGKVQKVCSEKCVKEALKHEEIADRFYGVNRNARPYRVR